MVIYTSGTTGLPKGILNNHAKLLLIGMAVSSNLQLGADDVGYACMPARSPRRSFSANRPAEQHQPPPSSPAWSSTRCGRWSRSTKSSRGRGADGGCARPRHCARPVSRRQLPSCIDEPADLNFQRFVFHIDLIK
jgi:hypothetical protein